MYIQLKPSPKTSKTMAHCINTRSERFMTLIIFLSEFVEFYDIWTALKL